MGSFLNLNSFAAKLGVHRHTAREHLKNDEYFSIKIGQSYYIPSFYKELKDISEYAEDVYPSSSRAMVLSLSNNKGGTGKTTNIINIAASLAALGRKVLIVDADTQANASTINGLNEKHNFKKFNLINILLNLRDMDDETLQNELKKTIVNVESHHFKGTLDLLPNSILMDDEKEKLFTYPNAENLLSAVLEPIMTDYDFILVDTHPSMDVMWRMSIMVSDGIILAIKPEGYSLEGFAGVFNRMYRLNREYKERKGRDIEVIGSIVAGYRSQTINDGLAVEKAKEAMDKYPKYNEAELLRPYISYTVKASEQQSLKGPIMLNVPSSNMCLEYLELTKNILKRAYFLDSARR